MKIVLLLTSILFNCGTGKAARIVNGEKAFIKDFPFHVGLEWNGQSYCGGVIYSKRVIITAAHCVQPYNVSAITVRAGTSFREQGGVLRSIEAYAYHKGYDPETFDNDIAVLKLLTPLKFDSNIKSIRLATKTPAHGAKAVASGFGINNLSGAAAKQLQKAVLKIVSRQKCSQPPYIYSKKSLLKGMICASGGKRDTCSGDSGGPLVVNGKLVAIVSSGPEDCGVQSTPGVYVDIAYYIDWIKPIAEKYSK